MYRKLVIFSIIFVIVTGVVALLAGVDANPALGLNVKINNPRYQQPSKLNGLVSIIASVLFDFFFRYLVIHSVHQNYVELKGSSNQHV